MSGLKASTLHETARGGGYLVKLQADVHPLECVRIGLNRYNMSCKYAIIHNTKVSNDDAKMMSISIKVMTLPFF